MDWEPPDDNGVAFVHVDRFRGAVRKIVARSAPGYRWLWWVNGPYGAGSLEVAQGRVQWEFQARYMAEMVVAALRGGAGRERSPRPRPRS